MIKPLSLLFQIFLCTLGFLLTTIEISVAQVTSDGTVNTQVNQNENVSEITGGEREGNNLFHSFQDFSVQTGNEASFLNANDIANIFSRVTGGNISNIDGLISANGSANLFLINPAGIIFGENARLDVGGSFYGSTADSILFEDGEFSATDLENPPVLTINAPIGLNLRDQPADIVNRSVVQDNTGEFVGLEVAPGNNLAFIGGDITFEGSYATARGGNIELGGLSAAGTVGINPDGSLSFPETVARADVNLTASVVDVAGTGGGNITVNARNLNLEAVESNGYIFSGVLRAGITADSTSPETQAGDIIINATESVALDNNSRISNNVEAEAMGNSGELNITTPNLSLTNSSSISTTSLGQGNAGSVNINATESITLDDFSFISSTASTVAEGSSGEVNINTSNLSLTNLSSIDYHTGSVNINATKSITLDESDISSTTVDEKQNVGELNITTSNLSLTRSSIDVNTFGQGNGGKLSIYTANLSLTDISSINGDSLGQGDASSIDINATKSITLNGSTISGSEPFDAEGNSGNLSITTSNLSLNNSSSINGDSLGQGDAGSIDINATESITLKDSSISSSTGLFDVGVEGNGGNIQISTGDFSISNNASIDASTTNIGNGGEINITANNLSLTNGGSIFASTVGFDAENIAQGDGGDINIDVADTLSINSKTTGDSQTAGIFASSQSNSIGNAGNIDITASKLSLINGSQINSFTRGEGNAGNTTINAQDSILLSGEDSEGIPSGVFNGVEEAATGNGGNIGSGGNINVTTKNLDIVDGATISALSTGQGNAGLIDINADVLALDNGSIAAQAFNKANGGNLEIDADVIVAYPNSNSDILASAQQGEGGNITINADSILGIEQRPPSNSTSDINASSEVRGLDGSVRVNTLDVNPVEGATQLPTNVIEPEQTTQQVCEANREGAAKNGLVVNGKGGIPATPVQPLTSQNIIINGEVNNATTIPKPIKTSKGKIQLARGVKFTEDGRIILTAYRTNNAGERLPAGRINCGQI